MSKYKKKSYRGYRRFKAAKLMRNYFKARLDTVQKVLWGANGVNFITGGNATSKPLAALLELCPDWTAWRLLFHSFKLTGVAVEVSPNAASSATGAEFAGSAVLALLTSRDAINWNNASEANFMFMLSPSQVQRKYKSFRGGLTSWSGTDNAADLDGKFVVQSDGNPNNAAATAYSVRFSFYVTFKNPN